MVVVSGLGRDERGRESSTVDAIGRDIKTTNSTNNILYHTQQWRRKKKLTHTNDEKGTKSRKKGINSNTNNMNMNKSESYITI